MIDHEAKRRFLKEIGKVLEDNNLKYDHIAQRILIPCMLAWDEAFELGVEKGMTVKNIYVRKEETND